MRDLIELEKWLRSHLPAVAEDLRPGASNEDLDAMEVALGVELPHDFRQLYLWHDGQARSLNTGPWYGMLFLPLEKVACQVELSRRFIRECGAEVASRLDGEMKSTPPGYVKRQFVNGARIPFASDGGGNSLGVDLDPDVEGRSGQVINFGRDELRMIAIAPSLGAFVRWMVGELHAGNHCIRAEADGSLSFHTRRPETQHVLDSLARIHPEIRSGS